MMLLKKSVIAFCSLLPIAIASLGGAAFIARKSHAQVQVQNPSAAAASPKPPQTVEKKLPKADDIDRLAQQLLDAARKRLEAQKAYYEEGRITIDRYVDACKQLELAELRIAANDEDRLLIRQRHLGRISEIEKREKAELDAGRGTVADLSEVFERRLEAELDLKLSQRQAGDMAALLRRLNDLEQKVEQLQAGRAPK